MVEIATIKLTAGLYFIEITFNDKRKIIKKLIVR